MKNSSHRTFFFGVAVGTAFASFIGSIFFLNSSAAFYGNARNTVYKTSADDFDKFHIMNEIEKVSDGEEAGDRNMANISGGDRTSIVDERNALRENENTDESKRNTTATMVSMKFLDLQVMTKRALDKDSASPPLPPETLGAFIHIGKTGGSTLSRLLRNGCHSWVKKPCTKEADLPKSLESAISKLTTYYHTPDFEGGIFGQKGLEDNHQIKPYNFFVITLRDPLSRAISSYAMTHPVRMATEKGFKRDKERVQAHRDMYSCFDSLEEYVQLLANFTDYQHNNWTYFHQQNDCASVAKTTLHHVNTPMGHSFWDLREVLYKIHKGLANKAILVVRTEFLWQDWVSANLWLGDEDDLYYNKDIHFRNSKAMKLPINMELSEEGRMNLCVALEKEYRLYLKLLVVSVNLSEEDAQESLDIARKNCPWLALELPSIGTIETFDVSKSRSWNF
mmetsp:Transcript_8393/g.12626  ORF Transcript_8393/g.12626 Transcript_8393/m.12626 type:complete len:450 (-) Transcript_8393:129-1478(-)|eukprot:CAMPEP_0203674402 /NCGR_PEP_ID=MMETSP0090-20130426/16068_1 /ASSEMBLY_ACC=CAM_ASM_001088 /TAXON_ID=426623 /ORGANISM="Chaetoceros affinis, Strain CCMP159" /LENGTH=449 /DNA_ID=CAMNT_0050540267 /DNA_START=97 /DNA_END=1446 /DNA_ORIENTATION=-